MEKYITQFYLLILCCFFCACKSSEEQQECLQRAVLAEESTQEYKLIGCAANDTVRKWADLKVKFFSNLNTNEWQIDKAVFFNKDSSKALLLLLEIDSEADATFDYVKILAAEKKGNDWHFYSQSMPTIGFDRTLNPTAKVKRSYTFGELSKISREEIINGGYFKRGSCNVNHSYIDDWFKEPLAEYHKEFLKNKIE